MIQVVRYPERESWDELQARPLMNFQEIRERVMPILEEVRTRGDAGLKALTQKFDGVALTELAVSEGELAAAKNALPKKLKDAIKLAYNNIFTFHFSQIETEKVIETMPGVQCWRKSLPIQKVGLYIPGGTAPLFSTILMLGIPAQIAGCKEVVLCSPPNKEGKIHPAILYTAQMVGVSNVYKVGGAQAIAAMNYGTESIPKVYKVFGPGNQYVTAAKQLLSQEGLAIDMPAGPSEVMVVADHTAPPSFVAADLLAQAEHGRDSQVLMLTDAPGLISGVEEELSRQLKQLPRASIAEDALRQSRLILLKNRDEIIDFMNGYAAEHLILSVENPVEWSNQVHTAGSVFLGHYSPESVGDYASGTNHTLPTNAFARAYSGVSLDSFVKKITFQKLSPEGLKNLGPTVEAMAAAEELEAHKQAVRVRLRELEKNS